MSFGVEYTYLNTSLEGSDIAMEISRFGAISLVFCEDQKTNNLMDCSGLVYGQCEFAAFLGRMIVGVWALGLWV